MEQPMHAIYSGIILAAVLLIFTLGKSPFFRVDRAGAAIIGAIATIGSGVLSFQEAMMAIDYKTIVILFFMMILVANLKLAGFFELVGTWLVRAAADKRRLLLAVILLSGSLSALAINDIVCLLFTPVVVLICRQTGCQPLPCLLGVAMASNIGSAATLLGNPQNILVGSLSGMSFVSYLTVAAPVAVVGLGLTYWLLAWYYRRELSGDFSAVPGNTGTIHPYLIMKSVIILILILAAYAAGYDLALSAGLGAAVLLMTRRIKPNKVYASVDFNLLVIFSGLFIIVAGVEKSGLVSYVLKQFSLIQVDSLAFFATLTVVLSNVVSNVPAVLLLKFVIPAGQDELWWQALALFSTLAGNLTITGSMANLIVAEMAKRQQVTLSAREYFVIGFPLTLLLSLLCYVWLVCLYNG